MNEINRSGAGLIKDIQYMLQKMNDGQLGLLQFLLEIEIETRKTDKERQNANS